MKPLFLEEAPAAAPSATPRRDLDNEKALPWPTSRKQTSALRVVACLRRVTTPERRPTCGRAAQGGHSGEAVSCPAEAVGGAAGMLTLVYNTMADIVAPGKTVVVRSTFLYERLDSAGQKILSTYNIYPMD